jgi:hypothetical protein
MSLSQRLSLYLFFFKKWIISISFNIYFFPKGLSASFSNVSLSLFLSWWGSLDLCLKRLSLSLFQIAISVSFLRLSLSLSHKALSLPLSQIALQLIPLFKDNL